MNKIELAKKIKALADNGFGGEAKNAAKILEEFCEKNNIDIEDLESEQRTKRFFESTTDENRRFIQQVISNVVGHRDTFRYKGRKKSPIIVEMTDSEYVETSIKIQFYWADYLEQKNIFYIAYIHRQELFANTNPKEITNAEEQKRYSEVSQMAQGIKKKYYNKRLKQ